MITEELENKIQEVIDEICIREKYSVTYAEINSALIKILSRNNAIELRLLTPKK